MGLRVAKFMKKQLEEANHTVEICDPVTTQFPVLTKSMTQLQYEGVQAPDWLNAVNNNVKAADAVVVVSAEYNHSIPPALSNMLDHFPLASFAYKPSGIVCYSTGAFGGMLAAMQLRCMLGELGCISVSNIFSIPTVHNSLDPDGRPLNDELIIGAKRLITQLDWHAEAMKAHRDVRGVPDL